MPRNPGSRKFWALRPRKRILLQEHADVVAIADVELYHLVAVGIDAGPRIHDLHPRLGFQALRKIVRKRNPRMRALAITIDDHKAGRLRLHLLPTYGVALGGRERTLQIALERIVRRRQAPLGQ